MTRLQRRRLAPPLFFMVLAITAGCSRHDDASAARDAGTRREIAPELRSGFGNDFAAAAAVPTDGQPIALSPGDRASVDPTAQPVPIDRR